MCRLLLDPKDDVFRIQLDGNVLVLSLSAVEMVEISRWAFTRKIVHIIEGHETKDVMGFIKPITQG